MPSELLPYIATAACTEVALSPQMSDIAAVVLLVLFVCGFVSLIGWGAWKSYTPRGVAFYGLMWCCMLATGICAWHSSWPSSAPRKQMQGIIAWIVQHGAGKSKYYTLGLASPSGSVLPLRASAMPPFFAERRDHVAVTYLDEKEPGEYPRAIAFHVLDGPRAGFADSVNADWIGPWIGVVVFPLCGLAAIIAAYKHKRTTVLKPADTLSITR